MTGATSASFTTPVLTSTTYYRVRVGCNTNVVYSNVSTVTVNNPQVATTNTPLTVCAGSPATLTATASAGSTVRFFSAATGGTALATTPAGSYTTPTLTTRPVGWSASRGLPLRATTTSSTTGSSALIA